MSQDVYVPFPSLLEATFPQLLLARIRSFPGEVAYAQKRAGEWRSFTWSQYGEKVCRMMAGLRRAGLKAGDRVAVMGDVSDGWLATDMAVLCSGGVTVGIYFTSSPEEIDYILDDCGATLVVVGAQQQLDAVLHARAAGRLDRVVVLDPAWTGPVAAPNVVSLDEFLGGVEGGFDLLSRAAETIRADDLATIGYTSGTTGSPKGAMLTQRSLICGADSSFSHSPGPRREKHRMVVHLPYSHTVARTLSTGAPLITGIVPFFGENTAEFAKTILEVRPTYWMAPPRFYQRFAAQLISWIGSRSTEERRDYALAMSIAKRVLRKRRRRQPLGPLLEGLYEVCRETVFLPLVAQVGLDQLRNVFTASAPMPPELMTLWQLWGVELKEVYGQTESVGTLVAQSEPWPEPGNIGRPNPDPNWEVKVTDDGEMIARGPSLFVGYLNKPDETATTLRDGWLHTGDVVTRLPDGNLKLIDRKKDLINTAGGKSISPTQIENEIRESPYISEAVVIGEGRKYLTALIEVDLATTSDWSKSKGLGARSYAELACSEDVLRLIEAEVCKANSRLARAEQIKEFRILPEELTPEGDMMTPTRKKKRKPINDHYRDLIETMYDDSEEKLILKAIA